MTNSNTSANNFSSIDAAFGLTTNNNNSEEIMTNSATTIDFDNLDDAPVFEYEQTTDGSAVTDDVVGLPMQQHAFTSFKTFGNPHAPTQLVLFYNIEHRLVSWKSPISARAKKLNQRMLQIFELATRDDRGCWVSAPVVTAINTDTVAGFRSVLTKLVKTIKSCDTVAAAEELLQSLAGTLFIQQWEEDDTDSKQYNTAAIAGVVGNVHDAQAVARRNEIAAFHVNANGIILDRTARTARTLCTKAGVKTTLKGSSSAWVAGCEDAAIAEWGFVYFDKTNSKRAYCGDALQAIAGLSADGMKSLVVADKEGKTFARHSMCKHIPAMVANPQRDNFYGEMADNQFAGHYGQLVTATYVDNSIFSTAVGDGGAVLKAPLTGTITKRLDASFNVLELRASDSALANASLEVIEAKVIERLCEVGTLAPGEVVMFEGQQLLQNGNLAVTISVQSLRAIRSTHGYANTEVATLSFTISAEAVVTDSNWKIRGLWLKAMTIRNDSVVLKDNDSQLILNANSVKNKKFMLLRMWANAKGHLIAFCKDGVIRHLDREANGNLVLGREINEAQVQQDLAETTVSTELTFVAHELTVERHKATNPKAYAEAAISKADAKGNVTVTVKVNTLTAPIVVALELSSVAENRVISSKVSSLMSDYITTFTGAEATASATIRREATRQANIVELCLSDEVNQVFDIKASRDFQEILKALFVKNHTHKEVFKALAQKFPKGIEVKGHCGTLRSVAPWTVKLPTQLLAVHGQFNKAGFSHNPRIKAVFAFLRLIASAGVGNDKYISIKECAFQIGKALEYWKQDVISGKGTLTKTSLCFEQHGFKVIANAKSAWRNIDGRNVPVIFLSNTNPLTMELKQGSNKSKAIGKEGRNAKVLRTDDVVFFYRNPLVILGVAVISVVDEDIVGQYAAAIAPDAFALNNCGDFDGDAINIIPASQFGIRNLSEKALTVKLKTNEELTLNPISQLVSLMEHPLLKEGLADTAIQTYSGSDDMILGGICKITKFELSTIEMLKANRTGVAQSFSCGLVLDRTAQMEQFNIHAKPNKDGSPISFTQVWVEDAKATANHYRVRVGQGYSIMFNAVSDYIAKYRERGHLSANDFLTESELIGVMASSVYCYEHLGLSGYSLDTTNAFKVLEDVAKERLGIGKSVTVTDLGSYQPISMCSGTAAVRGRKVHSYEYSLKPAAEFFAMAIIQRKLERANLAGLQSHILFTKACRYSAFRSLTKGMYNSQSKVSNALRCAKVNSAVPYAPLLEVLTGYARRSK